MSTRDDRCQRHGEHDRHGQFSRRQLRRDGHGHGRDQAGLLLAANVNLSLVVNTASDSANPGPGLTSLREAITYADTFTEGTPTITFAPIPFGTAQTIQLVLGVTGPQRYWPCRSRSQVQASRR